MNALDLSTVLENIARKSMFLDLDGNEKELIDINDMNWAGDSPLHIAAMNGDLDAVTVLVRSGASIDKRGEEGMTALHYSAMNNHVEILKFLLDHGADSASEDRHGRTPLTWAKMLSKNAAVEVLAKK